MTRYDLTFADDVPTAERDRVREVVATIDLTVLAGTTRVGMLAGGASNLNLLLETGGGERYVLRIAKTAVERFGVDRWRGADAQRAVGSIGLAPPLLAVALPAGHAVSPFVAGTILDAQGIRAPGMLRRVAETLRRVHAAMPVDGRFSVFDDQRRYVATARAEGLALPADIETLTRYADAAEAAFDACGLADRLCHNDLQLPNFIDCDDRLVVLDWEYAGMGNPYFDLGGVAANAQLEPAERRVLIESYFGEHERVHDARVELMLYMSALREATWAVIAEPVLELDWDYQAWAGEYYERCRRSIVGGLRKALEEAR